MSSSLIENNLEPFNLQNAKAIIKPSNTVFWLRRDLRLTDNAGLYYALKENKNVIPLFIFDTEILEKLEDESDRRVDFIYQSLNLLKNQFEARGSSLLVLHGNPIELFKKLKPKSVYTNRDYEPYAQRRDEAVQKILEQGGSSFKAFKDQVIFERDEVLKEDKNPYAIFTPYSKKWKLRLNKFYLESYPSEKYFNNLLKTKPLPFPTLDDIGFKATGAIFSPKIVKKSIIGVYHKERNFPAIHGTTHLGVHLRFGTISIRKLVQIALQKNQIWLNELI